MTSHARARGDGGAAIVEAALVLPVLIALIMGLIEFSSVFSSISASFRCLSEGSPTTQFRSIPAEYFL